MPGIRVKIGASGMEVEGINLLAVWPVKRINDGWTKRWLITALLAGCWLSTTGRVPPGPIVIPEARTEYLPHR